MTTSKDHKVSVDLEGQLAGELQQVLSDLAVGSDFTLLSSADLCSSLELFLPQELRRHYAEWETESLDGFFFACTTKTGPCSARFVGTCILIRDQCVTPFLLELALSPESDRVTSLRLLLGEPGGGRLGISGPPCNSRDARLLLSSLMSRINDVEWVYTVTRKQGIP